MIIVLLIAGLLCAVMAMHVVREENKKAIARKERNAQKNYSAVPWDADEYIKAFLEENRSNNKEYKLAALIVEDADGHKYVEDIDLRGDSAEPVSLNEFAIKRRYKNVADKFLYSTPIMDAIASKVNCVVEDNIERYYAFQLTLENVLSGRHGKSKKSVVNKYVMLLDLNQTELKRIANLSY